MSESAPSASSSLAFRLCAWSAWTPERQTRDDWLNQAAGASPVREGPDDFRPADVSRVPARLRRRTTEVGRHALASAMGLPHIHVARYVLSTRHGELQRTMSILDTLFSGVELSPTDFGMSVHHGLTGLLSIAANNTAGHSAISSGPESFCYGLLEAAACLHERPDQPVILIHYDEAPTDYMGSLPIDGMAEAAPIVVALDLVAPETNDGTLLSMNILPQNGQHEVASHVHDFLGFISDGLFSRRSVGSRLGWEWCRA